MESVSEYATLANEIERQRQRLQHWRFRRKALRLGGWGVALATLVWIL